MKIFLTLIALSFVLAACGPGAISQPVLDAEAVAQAVAEGIEVTFTGDECTVSGPAVLPEGEYVFILNGLEAKDFSGFFVNILSDGKTFQDVLDLQGGEPGKYIEIPDFVSYATKVDGAIDLSTGEKRVTYSLEEGEHYLAVVIYGANQAVWNCAPLSIVAE